MKLLSIVVPCYNEEKALPYFYEETKKIKMTGGSKAYNWLGVHNFQRKLRILRREENGVWENTLRLVKKEEKKIRLVRGA